VGEALGALDCRGVFLRACTGYHGSLLYELKSTEQRILGKIEEQYLFGNILFVCLVLYVLLHDKMRVESYVFQTGISVLLLELRTVPAEVLAIQCYYLL
jgi:hypothetical protein